MESLANIGLATMKRFKLLQEAELESVVNQLHEWPKHLFLAQSDRFELWAVNLGVFVMGHGSLDYRIRDSESMKDAILQMIKNLNRSLDEVLTYLHGNIEQGDEDSEADSDSEMESDMDLLLDSIKDPIDRLYKMAVWIRNPATRIPSAKARNFQQIDETTNVDLFKSYWSFDYDYVSSLFLEYEKNKALQENPAVQYRGAVGDNEGAVVEDEMWEPIRKVLELNRLRISNGDESHLIRRLARANGLRRQQFAYWRRHKDKLREHATVAVEVPTHRLPTASYIIQDENEKSKPPLSITTASQLRLLHGAGKEVLERENVMNLAISEYAPSAWNPSKDIVSFPSPPKISTTDEFFECPYCYTICPASILSEKAWRAHLIRDLRPYICTFEHCSNSEQLYDNRDDWIEHEISTHQNVFRCPKHEEQTFSTLEAYEEHTQKYHKEGAMPPSFAKSTVTSIHRSCPICSIVLGTMQKLQSHIALHLERFAMFALPRCTDESNAEDSGGRSAGAHIDSDRSLNGDLDTDSNTTGKTGHFDSAKYEMLMKISGMSREVETLRLPVGIQSQKNDQFFFEEMNKIRLALKKYGTIIRAWLPSKEVNTILFEFGKICIAAGLVDEAIETLELLRFFQNGQVEDDSTLPASWTNKQLTIAYQVNEALQDVNKLLGYGTDLFTEPRKSMSLDIFARTEAGMRHAETIWGPSIWITDTKERDRELEHERERYRNSRRPTIPRRQSSIDAFDRHPLPSQHTKDDDFTHYEVSYMGPWGEAQPELKLEGLRLEQASDEPKQEPESGHPKPESAVEEADRGLDHGLEGIQLEPTAEETRPMVEEPHQESVSEIKEPRLEEPHFGSSGVRSEHRPELRGVRPSTTDSPLQEVDEPTTGKLSKKEKKKVKEIAPESTAVEEPQLELVSEIQEPKHEKSHHESSDYKYEQKSESQDFGLSMADSILQETDGPATRKLSKKEKKKAKKVSRVSEEVAAAAATTVEKAVLDPVSLKDEAQYQSATEDKTQPAVEEPQQESVAEIQKSKLKEPHLGSSSDRSEHKSESKEFMPSMTDSPLQEVDGPTARKLSKKEKKKAATKPAPESAEVAYPGAIFPRAVVMDPVQDEDMPVLEEEPQLRGEVDQQPILLEVNDYNPERRFVIVNGIARESVKREADTIVNSSAAENPILPENDT